jgi:hypothetical protein
MSSFHGAVSMLGQEQYNFDKDGWMNDIGKHLWGRDFWMQFMGEREVRYP